MENIELRDLEVRDFKHPDLKKVVSIKWDHSTQSLIIDTINNPKIKVSEKSIISLNTEKYIILNPDEADYLWKLSVSYNKISKRVMVNVINKAKLSTLYFKIIDNQ